MSSTAPAAAAEPEPWVQWVGKCGIRGPFGAVLDGVACSDKVPIRLYPVKLINLRPEHTVEVKFFGINKELGTKTVSPYDISWEPRDLLVALCNFFSLPFWNEFRLPDEAQECIKYALHLAEVESRSASIVASSGQPQYEELYTMSKQGKLTDLVLKAVSGEKKRTVHRCVLYAQSDFYRAMSDSGMQDSKAAELDTELNSAEALEAFVHFLYLGYLPPSSSCKTLVNVALAADRFQIRRMLIKALNDLALLKIPPTDCKDVLQLIALKGDSIRAPEGGPLSETVERLFQCLHKQMAADPSLLLALVKPQGSPEPDPKRQKLV
jgi:hypothetical protein